MNFHKRRKLGLTLVNCFRVARDLNKAGMLSDDSEEAADQVVSVVMRENVGEWQKVSGPDWEAIMKWVEEVLIPFILMLMELFGGM